MADEQERVSYADYSVIDEYLKLKRDSEEIFMQHKDQLMELQQKVERLNEELVKKESIIDTLQQQIIKSRQDSEEGKNEKDRVIQQLQMQVQNLNSRLAGFQRKG
jgi:predicted RNase H-like nuclease (RuvC/YqgF family)